MEKLFETKFKYDFSEYKKMMYTVTNKKSNDQFHYLKAILWLFLLLSFCIIFNLGAVFISIISTLIFMMILFVVISKKSIQISYDSNKIIQEVTLTYSFYDEYFEITTEQINEKLYYHQLYNVLETETNYYILISNISGYCLLKKDIAKEKEFNAFLKSKVDQYLDLQKKKS